MRFYWERVESSRNFANKVWNASRFIMMNLEGAAITEPSADELQPADKWILSKVNTLAKDVTENMDKYEMGIAVQKVYDFIWDEFCDWYIEITKTRTYNKEQDPVSANAAFWTLKTVLTEALKLLHPFMRRRFSAHCIPKRRRSCWQNGRSTAQTGISRQRKRC